MPRTAGGTILAGLALAALWAAPAQAASPASWECRASAYYHTVAGNPRFEPVKADPVPCASASAGLAQSPATASVPTDTVSTRTLSALTTLTPPDVPTTHQTATAVGRVENLTLNLPGGALVLGVRDARATATARCQDGVPALGGSSEVAGLSLNGTELALPQLIDQINAVLAPLNQVVEIKRDEQVLSGSRLFQRALHVRVLNAGGAPQIDVVVGEGMTGASGAVCGSEGGATEGLVLPSSACPKGSVYEARRGLCVIMQSGVLGAQDRPIVVGRPFEGPSGGTVLSLRDARNRYGNTRCLRGSGPAFAVIGTLASDLITGTNKRDRILALAGSDRVDGGRGDDCIDGGSGRDVLSGALGKDRLYGLNGDDSLNGGPDADLLSGGSGNDSLNAAFGRDRLFGGSGRDVINVATAGPAARVSCGNGRDKVRANHNERARLRGCETRYVMADRPAR